MYGKSPTKIGAHKNEQCRNKIRRKRHSNDNEFDVNARKSCRIQPEDIVAMWLFDEVEKDVTKDLSGNLHHAEVVGNPELVEGKFGKAFAFAKGKYLEVPHHRKLQINDVITISVWVKRPLRKDANDIAEAPFYIMEKGGKLGVWSAGAGELWSSTSQDSQEYVLFLF